MLSFWIKAQSAERRRIILMGLVMLLAAVIINQLTSCRGRPGSYLLKRLWWAVRPRR
jgi:hypothetical protein